MSAGKTVEALAALDGCKLANPGDAEIYFVTGLALMTLGELPEAAAELKQAIDIDGRRGEYSLVYADALLELGQTAAAREVLQGVDEDKLTQLPPPRLWHLADLNFRLDRFQEALDSLDRFEEQQPEDAGVDFRRGEVYLKQQNLEAALRSFRRAADRIPGEGAPHFGVGLVLRFQNQLEPSREAFLRALQHDPGNAEYLWQLGEVLLALDRPGEAIERLQPVVGDLGAAFPDLYRVLGEAHRRLGKSEQGRQYMEKYQSSSDELQQRQAKEQEAYSLAARGEEKLGTGAVDEAVGLFQKALKTDADNLLAHGYLAKIFISSGFLQRALPHLNRIQELEPDSVEGNYLLATYWYQRRNYRKALDHATRAKARYPGSGELRNLLGNIYVGLGDTPKAVAEYQAAVTLSPDRSDFQTNYQFTREALNKE